MRRSATDGRWRLAFAGVPLTVERTAQGRGWSVLFGSFSRASGERLAEAIAIATGAQSLALTRLARDWAGKISAARGCA
jgi:hypothetical protein